MTTPASRDARVRELQLLAKIDRGPLDLRADANRDEREKAMIAELIFSGHLNGVGAISWSFQPWNYNQHGEPQHVPLLREIEYERWEGLNRVLGGQQVTLRMTHKGRVRLAELEQALTTGRDRDPTGTVISKRHLDKDLTIALVSATQESPVAVCMLDMNGLKQINDTVGHPAGDAAIDTYLKAIAVFLGDGAEGYRGDGGDELVVIARGLATSDAAKLMRQALTQLAKEKVTGVPYLSAACGVMAATDPNTDTRALLKRLDEIQYRAKAESKKQTPRPSVIAINDEPVEVLPAPVPGILQYMKEEAERAK